MNPEKIAERMKKAIKNAAASGELTNATLGAIVFEIFAAGADSFSKEDLLLALEEEVKKYGEGTIKYERASAVIQRLRQPSSA